MRAALALLDNIANNDREMMGFEDIEDLCEAREHLATAFDYVYNEDTNRYKPKLSATLSVERV